MTIDLIGMLVRINLNLINIDFQSKESKGVVWQHMADAAEPHLVLVDRGEILRVGSEKNSQFSAASPTTSHSTVITNNHDIGS